MNIKKKKSVEPSFYGAEVGLCLGQDPPCILGEMLSFTSHRGRTYLKSLLYHNFLIFSSVPRKQSSMTILAETVHVELKKKPVSKTLQVATKTLCSKVNKYIFLNKKKIFFFKQSRPVSWSQDCREKHQQPRICR